MSCSQLVAGAGVGLRRPEAWQGAVIEARDRLIARAYPDIYEPLTRRRRVVCACAPSTQHQARRVPPEREVGVAANLPPR